MSRIALSSRDRRNPRPRRGRRPLPLTLALTLALVALVGCQAAPQASPSASPSPGGSASDATPHAGTKAPGSTPAPPPGGDPVAEAVAWLIRLGPGAPSGPDEVTAYLLLQEHTEESCSEVLGRELPEATETLYHGAAAACLAGLHGRSRRWTEAEAAYDALGGRPEGCLNRATYQLLGSLIQAHRESPTATFRIGRSKKVGLACPTIGQLTVTRDASGALDIRVSGDRLGQVRDVGLRFPPECTDDVPELGDFQSATSFSADRRSLQASAAAGVVPDDATRLWVGLVAEPQPWIADHACVEISESDDGSEASPSASAPDDASPSAEP